MKRKILVAVPIALLVILAISSVFIVDFVKKKLYPRDFSEYVEKYSNEYNVPEDVIYSVIRAESGFDENAKSHAGAIGLMQLMPTTFEWLSDIMDEESPSGEITDAEANIKYGTYYLSWLYNEFGNWETAYAAYNAGQGRVEGWLENEQYSDDKKTLKSIPIEETNNYVNRVKANREQYIALYYEKEAE